MRLALGTAVLLVCSGLAWGAEPGLAQQQAQAKKQQAQLRSQIADLQKDIESQESSRRDAANALKASESAISDINARLADLQAQTATARQGLEALSRETTQEQQHLGQRQVELGNQLRAQYASGLSPWTALLSGDDPRTIGRDLAYLGYVSQAQADAVRDVRESIERLNALRAKAQAHEQELSTLAQETTQQKQDLQAQQAERKKVLVRIEDQLQQQRGQAGRLAANEKRLGDLISGLEAALAKQAEEARIAEEKRKAEAARKAEEARLAAIERQRVLAQQREQARAAEEAALAAQERARREQSAKEAEQARLQVERARAQARAAEQAQATEQAEQRAADKARADAARAAPKPHSGSGLTKGLAYPVRGQVLGRFGAQRPDGGVWRGVVLRSPEGTPVRVISDGRVAYSGWLAGFGNLIIVDHGSAYLSVYANNQSLLKQVGDSVATGDTIATVGSTGGQVDSGLYFEIRHNGTPVNPLLWLGQ